MKLINITRRSSLSQLFFAWIRRERRPDIASKSSIIVVTIGFLMILAASASAATFTVTKTADTNDGACDSDCSLREAIAAANAVVSDDVVEFSALFSSPQTILLAGTILQADNNGSLTINGPGPSLLTIDANHANSIFRIEGATAIFNSLKIANGSLTGFGSGGGILNQLGNLTVNNSVITGNSSGPMGEGGGIFNCGGSVTLNTSTVSNNSGGNQGGGGIASGDTCSSGSLTVNGSFIINNTTPNNGGGINTTSTLAITNTVISGNSANIAGGVSVYFTGNAPTFDHVSFLNNHSATFAGGLSVSRIFNITDCTFSGNTAVTQGGGLFLGQNSQQKSILRTSFSMNSAQDGGAIYDFQGVVTITDSTILNNTATRNGGGIYFDTTGTTATVNGSNISDNTATQDGGGILKASGTLNVNSTLLSGNRAFASGGQGGGGINNRLSPLNITNATICNNTSSARGGGILNAGNLTLLNVTVSGNTGSTGGGGIANLQNTVTARNTIIGDNGLTSGSGPDFSGTLSSSGYNLLENVSGATITGTTTGNILGRDPMLVKARANGGSTITVALQPNSPAIDTGDPNTFPSADQRGVIRPQDGDLDGSAQSDMGAYERQVTSAVVTKTADTNDGTCDADCSLREAIGVINASLRPDVAILFDALFNTPQVITLAGSQLTVLGVGTSLVKGPGAALLAIDGNNASRILMIETDGVAAIEGVTIRNGNDPGQGGFDGGGGIWNQGILALSRSTLTNNRAANFGGGLYTRGTGSLSRVSETMITNNTSLFGGGLCGNGGESRLTDTMIADNNATVGGGGIYTAASPFSADRIMIINNSADGSGGGIFNDSNAVITHSTIVNNRSTRTSGASGGGGIYNDERLILDNSTVINNTAANIGAGIYSRSLAFLTIQNSTVSGNVVVRNGGGIYNNSTLSLTNSTVTNNAVTSTMGAVEGLGGGIFNEANTTASLFHATISHNTANFGGAGIQNYTVLNSRSSIIADNTGGTSPDFNGTLTSQGYNLVENTSGMTIVGTVTGNILGQDPALSSLSNNGGYTLTRALLPGSPAIDAADPANFPPTDQRGKQRPWDGNGDGSALADIGAFERVPSTLFDFDGDGKADLSIFRPSVGEWYFQRSTTGVTNGFGFGTSTDKPVPADFTGDGKTDIAFFRGSTGNWFVLRSEDSTFFAFPFGASGDIPAPADYDGDGKSDAAVFRPSIATWFILKSTGGVSSIQFGLSTDVPEPADYDGDGKADVGIYRPGPGQWWNLRSSNGSVFAATFGSPTDKPVPGDYTGDGKADVAFYRPSEGSWYVLRSEDFSFFAFPFGNSTDKPAPADYDGDGKFDAAVFRPSDTNWYINKSSGGVQIQQFGLSNDIPLPGAFVP